jgi:hypothetical protein
MSMATTSTIHRRPAVARPARWAAGFVMGAVLAGGLPASAQSAPSVADARAALATARATRQAAERHLADLQRERAVLQARLEASSGEVNAITRQLTEARQSMRDRAVEAFVAGGDGAQLLALLGTDRVEDASARSAILLNQADAAVEAAALFQRLKEENDPQVVALATSVSDVERRIDEATSDVLQAAALEADAERALANARATAAAGTAASRATAPTATTPPAPAPRPKVVARPSTTGDAAMDRAWARLVECESGGDYTIVSSTGRYRGAYQFDQRTWESVGGTGDPAAAPPAEQDLRARILYERRGARAWPHCGSYLLAAAG